MSGRPVPLFVSDLSGLEQPPQFWKEAKIAIFSELYSLYHIQKLYWIHCDIINFNPRKHIQITVKWIFLFLSCYLPGLGNNVIILLTQSHPFPSKSHRQNIEWASGVDVLEGWRGLGVTVCSASINAEHQITAIGGFSICAQGCAEHSSLRRAVQFNGHNVT